MQRLTDRKGEIGLTHTVAWLFLLVVGLSFTWGILKNYALPFFGSGTLNLGDLILLFVLFFNIFKGSKGWGASKSSQLMVLLHIGIFIVGIFSLSLNDAGNFNILVRSSRGYLAILIAFAYGRVFNNSLFKITLVAITLSCPVALLGYSLNYFNIIKYGSFDYLEGLSTSDDVTKVIVSDQTFTRFTFIDTPSIIFCVCISLFIFATSKNSRNTNLLSWIGIISSYIVLLLNLGRSFIILNIICSIFMLYNISKYNKKKFFYGFGIICISIIISLSFFIISQGTDGINVLIFWFQGLIEPNNPSYGSVTVRQNHFLSAFEAFADSPLWGHGIGADFTKYHLKNGSLENPYNFGNTFSLRIAQTGLIGFNLWVLFNFMLVRYIYSKQSITSEEKLLRHTLFAVHIFIFLTCLTSGDYSTTMSFGLVYGCIILITDYINTYYLKLN